MTRTRFAACTGHGSLRLPRAFEVTTFVALGALALLLSACITAGHMPHSSEPPAPSPSPSPLPPGAGPAYPPPPGNAPPPGPGAGPSPVDLTAWTVSYSDWGSARLRPSRLHHSAPVFEIASDRQSTAWVSSPPFNQTLPYRAMFWVRVSPQPYNGFTIYDAVDAAGRKTDLRVYLHDDRDDYTAEGGWHGELWVKDAVGRYSVAPVPRAQWVKFTLARHRDGTVGLFVNDQLVGTFTSRSPWPLARIEGIGDTDQRWWAGAASWGPIVVF